MNLPTLGQLQNEQSTYITFSKSLLDLDAAISSNKKYYFTKMVALNLPQWKEPDFYIDLSSINEVSHNPNIVMPKIFQYYMENIIRQDISTGATNVENVVELAFWKTLGKLGLNKASAQATVTFINEIMTANFVKVEGNNGWSEIVGQIPNKCKNLTKSWKEVENVANTVQCYNEDVCLFDNGSKQFEMEGWKSVLDFDALVYSDGAESHFDFNTLLLFYTDETGVQKLHGINFIYPYEDKVTEWTLETFTQKTTVLNSVGYQFKFNMKSCVNESTQLQVYELQEHTHWNTFSNTLSLLNSFLEDKILSNDQLAQNAGTGDGTIYWGNV